MRPKTPFERIGHDILLEPCKLGHARKLAIALILKGGHQRTAFLDESLRKLAGITAPQLIAAENFLQAWPPGNPLIVQIAKDKKKPPEAFLRPAPSPKTKGWVKGYHTLLRADIPFWWKWAVLVIRTKPCGSSGDDRFVLNKGGSRWDNALTKCCPLASNSHKKRAVAEFIERAEKAGVICDVRGSHPGTCSLGEDRDAAVEALATGLSAPALAPRTAELLPPGVPDSCPQGCPTLAPRTGDSCPQEDPTLAPSNNETPETPFLDTVARHPGAQHTAETGLAGVAASLAFGETWIQEGPGTPGSIQGGMIQEQACVLPDSLGFAPHPVQGPPPAVACEGVPPLGCSVPGEGVPLAPLGASATPDAVRAVLVERACSGAPGGLPRHDASAFLQKARNRAVPWDAGDVSDIEHDLDLGLENSRAIVRRRLAQDMNDNFFPQYTGVLIEDIKQKLRAPYWRKDFVARSLPLIMAQPSFVENVREAAKLRMAAEAGRANKFVSNWSTPQRVDLGELGDEENRRRHRSLYWYVKRYGFEGCDFQVQGLFLMVVLPPLSQRLVAEFAERFERKEKPPAVPAVFESFREVVMAELRREVG